MIIDILQPVVNFSELKNQINLMQMNKHTYNDIYIYSLICTKKMDNNIIRQKKFCKLRTLCVTNDKVECLNHLSNTLSKLDCSGYYCGVNQDGIMNLKNLETLRCSQNEKIHSVNHLANVLSELCCCGSECGIDQNGIMNLKSLKTLCCASNKKIRSVNHLSETLLDLNCSMDCGIDQSGIQNVTKLKILDCSNNEKIEDVNHLAETLEELYCNFYDHRTGDYVLPQNGVYQNGISELKFLKILFCSDNFKINNVNHLKNTLVHLVCGGGCGIDQYGISELKILETLDCSENPNIINVNHMAGSLKALCCYGGSGVNDLGISMLKKNKVKKIGAIGNPNIRKKYHIELYEKIIDFAE